MSFPHVNAIYKYAAAVYIIKTQYQASEGGFSRTVTPMIPVTLPGLAMKEMPLSRVFRSGITEGDILNSTGPPLPFVF